ncbi:VOC family protein [Actinokineospora pegani]|uniref:VOC family protein n=1 Tax=Actinokineospora pegani TaxID=2654637 RepID=UPI0012EA51B2|nr:VOC family protein [Actinokineospora pegani]
MVAGTSGTLTFYQEVFGGDLVLNTFADNGAADEPFADLIMHNMLTTEAGYTLMASDTPPGMEFTPGTNITISLSGDDAEDLRGYWERLAEGGTVAVPLERQVWGDEFGQLTDRFGTPWMVNISTAG